MGGRVQLGFYLLVITYAVVTSTILFSCGLPFEKNWQIYPEPANSCQTTVSIVNYLVTVTLNIVTDIYLMAIPVPMLLNARLKTIKKLGLCLLFSGGIFVGTAAILRCVLALKVSRMFHVVDANGDDDQKPRTNELEFRIPTTMPTLQPPGQFGRALWPSWSPTCRCYGPRSSGPRRRSAASCCSGTRACRRREAHRHSQSTSSGPKRAAGCASRRTTSPRQAAPAISPTPLLLRPQARARRVEGRRGARRPNPSAKKGFGFILLSACN